MSEKDYRIAVLASGEGSTFEAAYDETQGGRLADTEIALVIGNNSRSGVLDKARALGIEAVHISNLTQKTCTLPTVDGEPVDKAISYEASERILQLVKEKGVHVVVTAGFRKLVIGSLLQGMTIANLHHAPVLATAGLHSEHIDKEIMRRGREFGGPSIHWMDPRVDEDDMPMYDLGPHNLQLLIDYWPVRITEEVEREWRQHGTATILEAANKRVEKLQVGRLIHRALEQHWEFGELLASLGTSVLQ